MSDAPDTLMRNTPSPEPLNRGENASRREAHEKDPDALVGRTLSGRYTILEPLARGGMGVVYRARHQLLNKLVAVKVLRKELSGDRDACLRFHREARAAASIGHPNIVKVTDYDFFDPGDGPGAFIVMEHLEGQNLRRLIQDAGALAPRRCLGIARQILEALAAAHEHGIIHRDLNSGNVFVTHCRGPDQVKLLDFGISKLTRVAAGTGADLARLTSTGVVMGTLHYIAPEQARGDATVDHRADLYALGVVLYEMLTGQLPFTDKNATTLLLRHLKEPPVPPSRLRADLDIPGGLEHVTLRALQKAPDNRYPTARAMLDALPEPEKLRAASAGSRGQRSRRYLGPVLALATVAGIAGLMLRLNSEDKAPALTTKQSAPAAVRTAARTGPGVPIESAPGAAARSDRGSPEPRARVRLVIRAHPAHARIVVDNEPLGFGVVILHLSPRSAGLHVRIAAPGHVARSLTAVPDRSREVSVTLRPATGTRPARRRLDDLRDNPYR